MPGDQRGDDEKSLCFDSDILSGALDIVGAPVVRMRLSCDKPVGQTAARLCDVGADGASSRVTYGVLNLCHRSSHDAPELLEPGREYGITVQLDDIACRVPARHRLRLALSSAYWPLIWPSPDNASLALVSGRLELPVWNGAELIGAPFDAPEVAAPWEVEEVRAPSHLRETSADLQSGETVLNIEDDFGVLRDMVHGLETGSVARETWSIHPDSPLSAQGDIHWTQTLARGGWSVRTEAYASMRSDAANFYLDGRLEAHEGEQLIFSRDFSERIARGFL